ncbi:NAD(P)-dependent oxidoreductase [Spiroplasma chrysopicola]|uniref:D-lactate dehydrogenase n=1 Tax=Spiroplasma chrysopicola DF-1 TaxID=1276227 RepID=R4U4M6_9MOLU|nr:NAD(P)-dependent oxidoreductase [Spiroplasma chrysopicola]AGM25518.1 D-lactate dehydrogenase [Spiroplasma chrysopicola DF-1]
MSNKIKMVCYGVRKTERPLFEELNKNYGYELTLLEEYLTKDNIVTAKGHDAVMVRANCDCEAENLLKMQEYGIKYLLTRTVGYNHIDLDKAHELGFKMAYVPGYSPNAVSELAVAMGNALLRNLFYMADRQHHTNFKVDDFMFAKEIRNSTIGIIGTGRIGLEAAKAWAGMGAKVLGYDVYQSDQAKKILTYVDLDTLIKESDLISLHCPYIKEQNHHLVNKEFLARMKPGSVLINAARGPLADLEAVYEAVKSGYLKGVGLDVLENEGAVFFKDFKGQPTSDAITNKLLELYPRVIITPHIGSYTDEAVKNMIEITYENLKVILSGQECKNKI